MKILLENIMNNEIEEKNNFYRIQKFIPNSNKQFFFEIVCYN